MKRAIASAVTILFLIPVASTDLQGRNAKSIGTIAAQTSDSEQSEDPSGGFYQDKQNPCAPPNHMSSSAEETAWRLWVAATCPVNNRQYPYVVWENWIEQEQMYPPDPAKVLQTPDSLAPIALATRLLHASPLALAKNPGLAAPIPGELGAADQVCTTASQPPKNQKGLIICEEVRLNGSTRDYIAGTGLWHRTGQAKIAAAHGDIEFPAPSVEVKADWISLSSINMNCANLPPSFTRSVHVENINGTCYALAGMHLISKLLGQWVWATFEPQNLVTNPFRCNVLGCSDSFGSKPSRSRGSFTALTPQLEKLMDDAHLAPEWRNYRLDGVQTEFVGRNGKPILLGNSIIEGENAGVPLSESSCITCHSLSSVKSDGTDGITLLTDNPVGSPEPLPSHQWIRRDFVWSLFSACPAGNPSQNCKAPE
jgi:hypothetical protein